MEESPRSPAQRRPHLWRIVAAVLVIGLAAGLLSVRPWDAPGYDCAVTVRPGESIQAAIDAAQPGDVICLARGEWTESLVIDKSVTLVGWGAGRTVIGQDHFHLPAVDITGLSGEPITVRLQRLSISGDVGHTGMTVGGTAVVELSECRVAGMLYGIQVSDSAHLTLSNSLITDCRQMGMVLLDSARVEFDASHVSENRQLGIMAFDSAEAVLRDSQVSRNGGHGLWLRDEARVTVSDGSISDNGMAGLLLTGQSQAQLLMSDVSRNRDQGIRAEDMVTVELTRSQVTANWQGIELTGSSRATVTDAVVSGSRFDGIRAEGSAHAAVSSSVLSSNRRGFNVRGAATAQVAGCLIENSGDYGLFSWSTAEVTGEGNRFVDNGMDLGGNVPGALRLPLVDPVEAVIDWPDERFASLQEAIDALLPGGRLRLAPGTYDAGLTITTGVSLEAVEGAVNIIGKRETLPVLSLVDGADLRLEGITVSGGSTGLSLAAGARAELVGCTVTGNTQGIHLSHSSSLEMAECFIDGNARSGIFVSGVSRATITDCLVMDHVDYGIAAANSAHLTVSDSFVSGSRGDGGIILWDSSQAILEGNRISGNRGYGVAIYSHRCLQGVFLPFRGHISGRDNVFETNWRGDFCPPELEFLVTSEGGELDYRPSPSP
jgi:parallel beta-helix repeat protein